MSEVLRVRAGQGVSWLRLLFGMNWMELRSLPSRQDRPRPSFLFPGTRYCG